MAGKYISRYSGAEIDEAVMKALAFDPTENGWIKIITEQNNPIDLNTITSSGNFVIEYFTGATEEVQKYSPINISIALRDGVLTQSIVLLDNVYYRTFDDETMEYGEWFVKKTTNYIYVDEYPETPEKNAIVIVPDDTGTYIMKYYNGTEYVDVYPPDIMKGSIYDPQGRETDFFKYVDDTVKSMTSSSLGILWGDNDVTSLFTSEISNYITLPDETIYVSMKNSSKIGRINKSDISIIELPVISANPQIIGMILRDDSMEYYIIDRDLGKIYFSTDMTNWVPVEELVDGDISEITGFAGTYFGETRYASSIDLYAQKTDGFYYYATLAGGKITSIAETPLTEEEMPSTNFYIDSNGVRYEMYDSILDRGTMCVSRTVDMFARIQREENEEGLMVTTLTIIRATDPEALIYELPNNEIYTAISNFKNIFGDYAGYAVTAAGRIDGIQTFMEEFFIENLYAASSYINWKGMFYSIDYLHVFGYSTDVFSAHILTTTQDTDLLTAVETHISDTSIHFSETDRNILKSRETKENVEIKFNRITTANKGYIDQEILDTEIETAGLHEQIDALDDEFAIHAEDTVIHVNETDRAYWNAKAEPDHEHNLDGKVKITAEQIVTGTLSIDRIPNGAKELLFKVNSMDERNLLTIDDVQNGDRVAVLDQGIYEVVDETKLAYWSEHFDLYGQVEQHLVPASDDAFHEAAAGSGVFIDWVNVENTPTTLSGYGITDSYTMEETRNEIAAQIKVIQDQLEARYDEFDLAELYRIANETKANIETILAEIDAAIAISRQVAQQDMLITEQNQRVTEMSEKMEESQIIVDNLLSLYS